MKRIYCHLECDCTTASHNFCDLVAAVALQFLLGSNAGSKRSINQHRMGLHANTLTHTFISHILHLYRNNTHPVRTISIYHLINILSPTHFHTPPWHPHKYPYRLKLHSVRSHINFGYGYVCNERHTRVISQSLSQATLGYEVYKQSPPTQTNVAECQKTGCILVYYCLWHVWCFFMWSESWQVCVWRNAKTLSTLQCGTHTHSSFVNHHANA